MARERAEVLGCSSFRTPPPLIRFCVQDTETIALNLLSYTENGVRRFKKNGLRKTCTIGKNISICTKQSGHINRLLKQMHRMALCRHIVPFLELTKLTISHFLRTSAQYKVDY